MTPGEVWRRLRFLFHRERFQEEIEEEMRRHREPRSAPPDERNPYGSFTGVGESLSLPNPSPNSPSELSPQQYRRPLVVSPHVWEYPGATAAILRPPETTSGVKWGASRPSPR